MLLRRNLRWYGGQRFLYGRDYGRHHRLHLCLWRDDGGDGGRGEGWTCETLCEALQLGILREKCSHALLELRNLRELAELRFVVVEEDEEGLSPVNVLRLCSQLSHHSLKHGASI